MPITPAVHKHIERMPLLIDCAPQVMVLALDRQNNLVEMPFVAAPRLSPAQLVGISLAELQRLLPDRLIGHDDASTSHQFLDIVKT